MTLLGSGYWTYLQYQKDTQKAKKNIHKRGMQLLSKNQITTYLQNKPHVLSIGNIHIPKDTESKHILVFGASGSGKSVLLSQFLNQINTYANLHNDKRHYIITDVKPEFVGKFAKPDDFIFARLIRELLTGHYLMILMIFQITIRSPHFYLKMKAQKIRTGA